MIVNERGIIVGDDGIIWRRDSKGLFSLDPRGYFIERLSDNITWTLFRKTKSSYFKVPYVRQVLTIGSISQCFHVAEIYDIRSYK
jgi:hypothetical protein